MRQIEGYRTEEASHMSGICGTAALDGRPIENGEIRRMVRALEGRGPDATNLWQNGSVAFGHTLLATTPEALGERLPLTHNETGCTITADVRLDNRDQLLDSLGLRLEHRAIGDAELLLYSYLTWGQDCPNYLLGDFAFAIWDQRKEQLFCARDHIGMRQLVYSHEPGRNFFFATEPTAIIENPRACRLVNEERLVDFFIGNGAVDLTSTFYHNVYRLPPAHSLVLTRAGLHVQRYWRLERKFELFLESDEAYVEKFLEVFEEAISCRLRGGPLVGAMLSGGIDSGAVVAVASRIRGKNGDGPLQTFSAVGDNPGECNETSNIMLSSQRKGVRSHFIHKSDLCQKRGRFVKRAESLSEPFDGSMTLLRAVYQKANDAGMKVVLDGAAGDLAFDPGNYLTDLIKKGKGSLAFREAVGQAKFWGASSLTTKLMARSLWHASMPASLKKARKRLLAKSRAQKSRNKSLIDPNLARRGNFELRLELLQDNIEIEGLLEFAARAKALTHPHLVLGRECYDRLAAGSAIEPRDPYADRRLLEFCMSLPADQLERDGWPKFLLRRAMKGLVSQDVAWGRGKAHLGWEFTEEFMSVCDFPYEDPRELIARLEGYIDVEHAKECLMGSGGAFNLEKQIYFRYLAAWLDTYKH
ncbi:hypothetical protein GRF63_03515 [Erythrobacter sp. GH3-10]|uniref:asparagine synthase (glutamine-hydrolyzing) n=1 Tax=Aurantiacibacter rhizosphaerae TaxID=2691582 RepID=A0A844X9F0_9SPHN|nr:hypothetical protein [Aurantiacibacter rhizosphaerae]